MMDEVYLNGLMEEAANIRTRYRKTDDPEEKEALKKKYQQVDYELRELKKKLRKRALKGHTDNLSGHTGFQNISRDTTKTIDKEQNDEFIHKYQLQQARKRSEDPVYILACIFLVLGSFLSAYVGTRYVFYKWDDWFFAPFSNIPNYKEEKEEAQKAIYETAIREGWMTPEEVEKDKREKKEKEKEEEEKKQKEKWDWLFH